VVAQQSTTPGPSLARRGITASFSCAVVSQRIMQSPLGMTPLPAAFSGTQRTRRVVRRRLGAFCFGSAIPGCEYRYTVLGG